MSLRIVSALLSALGLLLVGCAGEDGQPVATTPPSGVATDSTVADVGATTTSVAAPETTEPPAELIEVLDLGVVILGDPAPGPHPVLSWEPFDGSTSYWLMVSDSAGDPYWAWTGGDTSVRVGGGDSDDANQTALVHEEMTWRVAAFDESGTLVALSETGSISP